jgi:hypothetical protein
MVAERRAPMRRLVLPLLIIVATSCGDNGPDLEEPSLWRLTSVNALPLPAPGNATAGETWVAAVLRLSGETGNFDRCMGVPSTSDRFSRPTALVVHPIGDDKVELSYFDRRTTEPDTATFEDGELALRYRNVVLGQVSGVDVLTFVLQPGAPSEACSLAP